MMFFKINVSKLILACVLGGIIGNVFAVPTKISCIIQSNLLGKNIFNIEFDDNKRKSIIVNGNEVKADVYGNHSSYDEDRALLRDFNASSIIFSIKKETVGSHHNLVTHDYYLTIDRGDGSVKLIYEKPFQGISETSYGKCVKAADIVKKF